METGIQKHIQVDPETGEVLAPAADFAAVVEELVAAARGQGIELTGPDGLLTDLTRQVLQSDLFRVSRTPTSDWSVGSVGFFA